MNSVGISDHVPRHFVCHLMSMMHQKSSGLSRYDKHCLHQLQRSFFAFSAVIAFSALTLLVGCQESIWPVKN